MVRGRSEEPKPTTNQAESTLAVRILREISGAHAEQLRLDVEAMMQGIAGAPGLTRRHQLDRGMTIVRA
jgi:hypothetical protein